MPDSTAQHEVVVFPTELAMRRHQQERVLESGWIDAGGQTTFARLYRLCLYQAEVKGDRMSPPQQLLQRQRAVEDAGGRFAAAGPLGRLSRRAQADVLNRLLRELAMLPDECEMVVEWMLAHPDIHKLHQLGTLYRIWQANIQQEGLADSISLNRAMLKVLRGRRENWPHILRAAERVVFRSVRWFSPLEERCVAALSEQIPVQVESELPPAHAEAASERLGQRLIGGSMFGSWAKWVEDVGDALAVEDAALLDPLNAARIDFSTSAGAYGEIEDLARRIIWYLDTHDIAPYCMALVVPDLALVQDIVPHVFGRFKLPYFFRRGRPVLSSPSVKAFFSLLAFPLRPERDALEDLLQNPALNVKEREATLATFIKKKSGPRVNPAELEWFRNMEMFDGRQALATLNERVMPPTDHFNAEAIKQVKAALEGLGDISIAAPALVDMLEELLQDSTVRPRESHEHGVYVINPQDAVGLRFDVVLFARLNEGHCPKVIHQDSLLSDEERSRLRRALEKQGVNLPQLALPQTGVLFEQQKVCFLAAMGMAREQMVFSYCAVDEDGHAQNQGDYYRKLWNLAGWERASEIETTPYDQWRIAQAGPENAFSIHLEQQRGKAAEERSAMPGESFQSFIPLALACSRDEVLQAAAAGAAVPTGTASDPAFESLMERIGIETQRRSYLDAPEEKRPLSRHCGQMPALQEKVSDWFDRQAQWSPTVLEKIARCRYIFLLETVFGLRDEQRPGDMPDPLDLGRLIHDILKEVYSSIATGKVGIGGPRLWAVRTGSDWKCRNEEEADAVPLAVFDPAQAEACLAFAETVARRCMQDTAASGKLLGHPGIWAAEREKVLQIIRNYIRCDVERAAAENRYPALFEHSFGDETAITLAGIRIKGKLDRVDLIFTDDAELQSIRVLDYKGTGRKRTGPEEYMAEIHRNLNCQLPLYAFAAQQRFFGTFNTPETNAVTQVGFHFHERNYNDMGTALKKSLICLDEPGLIPAFIRTLESNLKKIKAGDFSVDPLIGGFDHYESILRTTAVDPFVR